MRHLNSWKDTVLGTRSDQSTSYHLEFSTKVLRMLESSFKGQGGMKPQV